MPHRLLVLILLLGTGCVLAEPPAAPGAPAAALPLGVYWPGECTFQEYQIPKLRWQHIDAALDDLAAHQVTAIWLTHVDATTAAEFTRHAAKRGIGIVASLSELAGEEAAVRQGDHAALVANTLKRWGDAPRPLAWGLGDEPRAAYMDEMATYAKAWKTAAPEAAITTTVMWSDIGAAAALPFDCLATDVYPFFSAGNPHGYGLPVVQTWTGIADSLVRKSRRAWMMGQAYQEPWGPYELDDKGNIVYLPGGAPHWVMPTPAQIKWQAWTTVACGAKGMFYFLYRWPLTAQPTAAAATLPAAVKERTNSGTPRALVHDDGSPTPQYEAMAAAYGAIGKLAPLLAPLQPVAASEAWLQGDAGSAVVRLLADPDSGKRYLVVVGPYEGDATVHVTLGPHLTGLTNLATGAAVPLSVAAPFRTAALSTTAGDGQVFACAVDPAALPQSYIDDFSTTKYQQDALNGDTVAVKRYDHAAGAFLSAADGSSGADRAFLVYDLDKLLGPLPAGGVRLLIYAGLANPPDFRGAFWSASADGTTFRDLSANEFGKPVLFTERYLKIGVSWRQSTSPAFYGKLSRFTLAQWATGAKP